MAEASWPSPNHNSGAVNDEEYERLAHPQAGDGIVGSPSDTSVVFADSSGRQVKVRANKFGIVRGRHWDSGSVETIVALAANSSGSTRIDTVVLRLTRSTWDVTVEIVQGTPGAGAPALTQDLDVTGVYEVALGDATVINGSVNITAAQFTRREFYLGEPLIVCHSGGERRPPHSFGRRIWEDGKEYVSTGAAWVQTYPVVVSDDSGNVPVTPASGWALSTGWLRVRKLNGYVSFDINLSRSGSSLSANAPSTLCTIPSGYRPSAAILIPAWANSGLARLSFLTNNQVQILNHAGMASGTFVCGQASWVAA